MEQGSTSIGMLGRQSRGANAMLGMGITSPPITPTNDSTTNNSSGTSAAAVLGIQRQFQPISVHNNLHSAFNATQNSANQRSVSPGTKRNAIPLPNLPVTPSTPNAGPNLSSFQYPNERQKSALWVLLHGADDGLRGYQNPAIKFDGAQQILTHEQMLKPDDLNSIMLTEHIMNESDQSSNLRHPMIPPPEFPPGSVENSFSVPEWPPRPDMAEAKTTHMPFGGLTFDGKTGMISPPAFPSLAAPFFKMDNPYASIDFSAMLNSYPTLREHAPSDRFPNDPFYPSYPMGLYEGNMADGSEYPAGHPMGAHALAMKAKSMASNGKSKKKNKKKKSSWTEDSSNNNSKRLRRNWTDEEERKFLEALEMYGRDWHKCAAHLGTRDVVSCRSHAQKYFIKLWINGEPLPKKVAEQGAGYTVSGKPLDPDSSFVKYYMSLFDKRRQGSISRGSTKSIEE